MRHFKVVTGAGMILGVFLQKVRDLFLVAAFGVAFQCTGIILMQLIIQATPDIEGFLLLQRIFPCKLPLEKLLKNLPEMAALQIVK